VNVRALERIIGVEFREPGLLLQALTHSSAAGESPEPCRDNERLEFLGDAVLHFLAARALFHRDPDLTSGDLTIIRSKMVSTAGLALAARRSRLGEFVVLGRGLDNTGGREQASILANAFEAVVAAIYLDSGLDAAETYFRRFAEEPSDTSRDAKSTLAILTQSRGGTAPTYRLLTSSSDSLPVVHTVEVRLDGIRLASGTGLNRQAAEQAAAQLALDSARGWEHLLPFKASDRTQDMGA
jgi:ribonuclease III